MDSSGPVLIGVTHSGKKNAEKLIAELKKQGVKIGEVIALEMDHPTIGYLNGIIQNNRFELILDNLRNEIELTNDKDERFKIRSIIEEHKFWNKAFTFFIGRKMRIVGFDSRYSSFANPKEKITLFHFVDVPLREKGWLKRLKSQNPNFIVSGSGHYNFLKRNMSCKAAVDLSGISGSISRGYSAFARMHYNVHKRFRWTKRKLSLRRK